MPNSPHRPFVPKRTPPEKRAPASESEFRVAPPFVHGGPKSHTRTAPATEQPRPVSSIADFLAMDATPVAVEHPAPIADFLASEAPPPVEAAGETGAAWAEPQSIDDFAADEASFDYAASADASESYDLPPIEHFTDPMVQEESSVGGDYGFALDDPFAELPLPATSDEQVWEERDWQQYDWRSAAALGEAGDPAAISAWAQTDWDNPASAARDVRESAAQAIADALDGIARRIREGDLVIPQPPAAVPDPATIAATLAALLGVRR